MIPQRSIPAIILTACLYHVSSYSLNDSDPPPEGLHVCFQDANGIPAASSSWAEEFQGRQDSPVGWADQFHEEMHPPNAWADQFEAQNGAEQWAEDFAAGWDQGSAQGVGPGDQEYVMAVDNPFLSVGIS